MACRGCGSRKVITSQPVPEDIAAIAARTGQVRMIYRGRQMAPVTYETPVTRKAIQVQKDKMVLVDPKDATHMRYGGLFELVDDVPVEQPMAVPTPMPTLQDGVPFAAQGAHPREKARGRVPEQSISMEEFEARRAAVEAVKRAETPVVPSLSDVPSASVKPAPDGGPPVAEAKEAPAVETDIVFAGPETLTDIPGIGHKLSQRMNDLGIDVPDHILGWDDDELGDLLPGVSEKNVRKWKEHIMRERE